NATFEDMEVAVVKQAIDRWAARCLPLSKALEEIRSKAEAAVRRMKDFPLYKIEGPVEFEIEWTSTAECKRASLVPGSYCKSPRVIAYKGENVYEAWRGIHA